MSKECSHQEAVREVVRTLKEYGYIVKTEAWASTILGHRDCYIDSSGDFDVERWYRDFKFNVANMFLGRHSPWISIHNPNFQTRLDVVGLYYADCEELSLYSFFARTDPFEVAKRTILVEVEHRHSLEEAIKRIKDYPAGRKVILWTGGEIGGVLEEIPIVVAKKYEGDCYISLEFTDILEEHIREIKGKNRHKWLPF
ncbi:hypothetical protein [Archaeoglobus profundus]|uniref:Uncharacterized protein n=2 Tax=Archaeoglobus profundus TaxID=84156 RepID=D2RIC5_ARCPA|nr:hypothetical protein [Archaeoglobus profundus]ACS26259.1 unknown [Archaeoglobus profundus]ADB58898.1 hypothetical protein Arcpr_1855 [Archaeoglobus profundus DSM 5631]